MKFPTTFNKRFWRVVAVKRWLQESRSASTAASSVNAAGSGQRPDKNISDIGVRRALNACLPSHVAEHARLDPSPSARCFAHFSTGVCIHQGVPEQNGFLSVSTGFTRYNCRTFEGLQIARRTTVDFQNHIESGRYCYEISRSGSSHTAWIDAA